MEIPWGQIFLWLHITIVAACAVRVLYKQHNIGTAFAWLIVLFVFPILGAGLYLLIGEPRLGTARAKRTVEMNRFYRDFAERYLADSQLQMSREMANRYHGISRMAAQSTGLAATNSNAMTLLNAVMAASKRGVDCMILADAVGSKNFFGSEWVGTLRRAGVEVHAALPVGLWRTLFTRSDLRNHRKILIVDKKIGYTGSFNLVDPRFFKQGAGVGEWVDVMMRCTGPVVLEMTAVFYADLAVENDQNLSGVQQYLSGYSEIIPAMIPDKLRAGQIDAQVIPSSPAQQERVIYETIVSAIYMATQKIVITTPYFVPDEPLLGALTTAARRGVEVTLILPEKVDSLMVRYASRAYYPMLLAAGVKIALFKGGLLHAKTMTIDDDFTLFGTVNMDMRSFFLNLEISLAIYDKGITQQISHLQQGYLQDSEYITVKDWQKRAKWWGLVENTVRLMSPLL